MERNLLKDRFEDLSYRIGKKFGENNVTEDDIVKAVSFSRSKDSGFRFEN